MKSKLGQNFLINKKIAEREVNYANIKENDIVLEIGPGRGILTNILSKKAKKVIAIELDKKLIDELKNFVDKNVKIIHGDILKVDFSNIPRFNKIVSNLPFQISSPLTFKIFEYDFDLAIFIYQKEFAERLIAKVGDKNYSRLSVNIYYKAICEILEYVPKNCFKPQPKIDSCIVKMIPRKNYPFKLNNEKLFYEIINMLFSHRRKKIKTILKEKYKNYIDKLSFIDNRAEELTPEQLGKLSNELSSFIKIN